MNSIIYQILDEPYRISTRLSAVDAEIEELRTAMLPGAVRYDKDDVMASSEDCMVEYAIRLEPLLQARDRLLREYAIARKDFDGIVSYLTDKQRTIITMKYLYRATNTEIGKALGIHKRTVLRLCDKSYELLLKVLTVTPCMCYHAL